MSLKSFQNGVLREDGVGRKGLAGLLRDAASARLQRLGPEAAVGTGKAHGAVGRCVGQWDVDLQPEAADEVLLLVAVEDDGMDDSDRSLAGVEVEAHGKGEPLAFGGGATMHAFDLDDGAHRAGLLDGDLLYRGEESLAYGRIFGIVGGTLLQNANELASTGDSYAIALGGFDEVRAGVRDGGLHRAGIHDDRVGFVCNFQCERCSARRGARYKVELAGEACRRNRGEAAPLQRAIGPVGHRPTLEWQGRAAGVECKGGVGADDALGERHSPTNASRHCDWLIA